MNFYNERDWLYLETDVLGVRLGASLVQVRDRIQSPKDEASDTSALWPITFASKSLISAERYYKSIQREVVVILRGLEKFKHYYSICEVSMI